MHDTPDSTSSSPQPAQGGNNTAGSAARRLGDFEIRREIGRGGMGTVFEAWQFSLQRTVALKVLDRQVSASPQAVVRFQREAQAAAKLHHTHIVPIYAQGEEDGVYFYAMEMVEGKSLSGMIAAQRGGESSDRQVGDSEETIVLPRSTTRSASGSRMPAGGSSSTGKPRGDNTVILSGHGAENLSPEHFVYVAEQLADVADALEYAHRNGVIHRDIKPHNLLLGEDGRLRISDFGLARLAEQPGVTMTGELVGSPLYMSPEQIRGGPEGVDQRTDIYSLGATMYEWLTLTPPYPGETREQVISKIICGELTPPRSRLPHVPVDLETICLKALERDPGRRYESAASMRDDLRRFLLERPILARRAGPLTRFGRFIGRHQVSAVGTTAVLLALVLGWGLVSTRAKVETQTRAVVEAQEAVKQAEQRAEQAFQLLDQIASLPPEVGVPLRVAGALQGMVEPGGSLPFNMPSFSDITGGSTSSTVGVGSPAAIARRVLGDIFDEIVPVGWPGTNEDGTPVSAVLQAAVEAWRKGDVRSSLEFLDGHLAILEARQQDDFNARQMRAMLSGKLGSFERMTEDGEALVRMNGESAASFVWRGLAHLLNDRVGPSLTDLTRATELDGRSAWARAARGLALVRVGRMDGALVELEEALRRAPHLRAAMLGRASALTASGRFDEALTDLNRIVASDPRDADALTLRGDCHTSLGNFEIAAQDFQDAMLIAGQSPRLVVSRAAALLQLRRMSRAPQDGQAPDVGGTEAEIKTKMTEPVGTARDGAIEKWFSDRARPSRDERGDATSRLPRPTGGFASPFGSRP